MNSFLYPLHLSTPRGEGCDKGDEDWKGVMLLMFAVIMRLSKVPLLILFLGKVFGVLRPQRGFY